LAAERVTAVFYVSGVLAEQYPDLMRAIVGAGHKVAAHGWSQHIVPATQEAAAEKADLHRCLEALETTSGMRPRGWISPRCTPSAHTTGLLRAAGLSWHSDFFDEDLPRVVQTEAGPITAVPFTMEVNDMPMSVRYGNEPEAYTRTLQRILDGWSSLPPRPACLDVTVHAHVYGRPMGAMEFARSLQAVAQAPDAFLTEHDALGLMFAAA
jgi:peptidoglycan/xylan/chitin deacetylase (PgdA/CDA1 family)